ncbi:hypothetical protein AVDCRST_MAG94-819, partial [uncultured Leptolyngbya sp.]
GYTVSPHLYLLSTATASLCRLVRCAPNSQNAQSRV